MQPQAVQHPGHDGERSSKEARQCVGGAALDGAS